MFRGNEFIASRNFYERFYSRLYLFYFFLFLQLVWKAFFLHSYGEIDHLYFRKYHTLNHFLLFIFKGIKLAESFMQPVNP